MLSINSSGMVTHLIEHYRIWTDYQRFYKKIDRSMITHDINGIPCFHYTDIAGINNSVSDVVVIDNLTESLHSQHYFRKYRNDARYIIFSAGWWDTTKINLPINYDLVYFPWFLIEMTDNYFSPLRLGCYIDKVYNFSDAKPFNFISTTGNVRAERTFILEQLTTHVKNKNFIFRYSGQDKAATTPDGLDIIKFQVGEFDPYTVILNEYFHNVSQTIPIDIYNLGYFMLLIETDLSLQHCFFATEKTIKTLVTGIPFVIAATPHFLKNLKKLGFETYSSLWDESYDDIEDFNLRMIAIAKLCNELEHFDWKTNLHHLEQIAIKNRSNFLRVEKTVTECFTEFERMIRNHERRY